MHFTRGIGISLIAHMGLIAVVLLTGAISAPREERFFTVSLFDNMEDMEKSVERGRKTSSTLLSAQRVSVDAASQGRRPMPAQKVESAAEAGASPDEGSHDQSAVSPEKGAGVTATEAAIEGREPLSVGRGTGGSGEAPGVAVPASGLGTGDFSETTGPDGRGTGGTASDLTFRQKIRAAIRSNLIYPYLARKRRMAGTVRVQFRIDHKGIARHISIVQGSGYPMLDSAARETVIKASPFPAADKTIEIPITFELKDD
jgi:TonB family protein